MSYMCSVRIAPVSCAIRKLNRPSNASQAPNGHLNRHQNPVRHPVECNRALWIQVPSFPSSLVAQHDPPRLALYSLTESACSPFHAEPTHQHFFVPFHVDANRHV